MGNRCLIAFKEKESTKKKEDVPCIYLHWNGGRDSVEAFPPIVTGKHLFPIMITSVLVNSL